MALLLSKDSYINEILLNLQSDSVSDVHIKSDAEIRYRFNGDIVTLENSKILSVKEIINDLSTILNERIKTEFNINKQVDFSFAISNKTRYRANMYKTTSGISLALRKINNTIKTLEELMAPEIIKKIAHLQKGLVIISGPTGSGKSTTLNSIINYINNNFNKHIITIEDPIEFLHTSRKCLINQREVGNDTNNFSLAIKSALREDPDIILIGEIRDAESIKQCLHAAETGHLVFTTMHTQTAAKSIDRIIDSCEVGEKELIRSMLSTSLQAVILQKLIKTIDNKSRVAAYEVLLGINSVRNLIRENKINAIDSMIQINSRYGMIDMKTSIEKLYSDGLISKEEMNNNLINLNDEK